MPTLIWIAFWSCLMGAATCWQEAVLPTRPTRTKETDRGGQPAV